MTPAIPKNQECKDRKHGSRSSDCSVVRHLSRRANEAMHFILRGSPLRFIRSKFALQYRVMIPWIAVVLIALIAAVAAWLVQAGYRRDSQTQAAELRQEMQSLAASQTQAMNTQLGQLGQSVITQLGQVTQQVQAGMAATGALTSNAQRAVSDRLQASTEMLTAVQQKLGEMQQAGKDLSEAAKQIENVLGGAKSRGTLGEVALERILADSLPASAYQCQHRFSTGEIVDACHRFFAANRVDERTKDGSPVSGYIHDTLPHATIIRGMKPRAAQA